MNYVSISLIYVRNIAMANLKTEMEYVAKLGHLAALELNICVAYMGLVEIYCKQAILALSRCK